MMDLQSSLMLSPTSDQEFPWGTIDSQTAHGRFCPTPSSDESQLSFIDTTDTIKDEKKKTSTYKHVPHREKPPHLVARRNARERRRVQAVNGQFAKLRKCVPIENRSKRLSKVKTLQRAIEYIAALQRMLEEDDAAAKDKMNNNVVRRSLAESSSNVSNNNNSSNNNNNNLGIANQTIHSGASAVLPPNGSNATVSNVSYEQIGEVSSTSTFKQEPTAIGLINASQPAPISWNATPAPAPAPIEQFPSPGVVNQQDYPYMQYAYPTMATAGFQSDVQYQCAPLAGYAAYQTVASRLSPHSC